MAENETWGDRKASAFRAFSAIGVPQDHITDDENASQHYTPDEDEKVRRPFSMSYDFLHEHKDKIIQNADTLAKMGQRVKITDHSCGHQSVTVKSRYDDAGGVSRSSERLKCLECKSGITKPLSKKKQAEAPAAPATPQSRNLNQQQFDRKFQEIMLTEAGHGALENRTSQYKAHGVIPTTIGTSCNYCDNEPDVNALYHTATNTMHWKCPKCGMHQQEGNWFDTDMRGNMKHYETGEVIAPRDLPKMLSKPDKNLPPAPERPFMS